MPAFSKQALKEVAIELGYRDAAHFAHDFKGCFGASPGSFGQRHAPPVSGRPDKPPAGRTGAQRLGCSITRDNRDL